MTEKLFYNDAYITTTDTEITSNNKINNYYEVTLNQTIFYPEGGGQPADTGTINGIPVKDVQTVNGDIIHFLEEDPGSGKAKLVLDFDSRYDFMQQHTAQHILSQTFIRLMEAHTRSFHLSKEYASIEISTSSLPDEMIDRVENQCANLIFKNLPVMSFETEDISDIPLTKPPKVAGVIRIINAGDYDLSACGGTHVKSTGELGLIKVFKTENIRGNVRVFFLAGKRALKDYQEKTFSIYALQSKLTATVPEIMSIIDNMQDERNKMKKKIKSLMTEKLDTLCENISRNENSLIIEIFDDFDMSDLRIFVKKVTDLGKNIIAITKAPEPFIIAAKSKGDVKVNTLSKEVFTILDGKGGGSDIMIQGKFHNLNKIEDASNFLKNHLK